ncbi:DEAD/DEAH box helicase [Shewanella sp. WXL01]|uniref:DEAD/DEAH box helicase n=1 Tax=Shewanella sp. WXL01 TaxID=2709721 RepID=UPI0014383A11|nr:DEAD/DEAH box helicase [Shewanella sp. WXL01]NKF50871.1 DEAD/DEAH box helicase [Shewanella sp. WXL01]
MSFAKLGLSQPIVNALDELNYQQPTPIQAKAIPVALSGNNIIAAAQTGTGKTASFVLPILQRLVASGAATQGVRPKRIKALILAPTRELVLQVQSNIKAYSKNLNINALAMYGGVDSKPQKQTLIEGVHILIATPGRLLDMYTQRALHFDELEVLVLDEADRMLDMGFIDDINRIVERLPERRQSMLFSATLNNAVRSLAKTNIKKATEISLISKNSKPLIKQWAIPVDKDKKSALLSHLINQNNWLQALIFIGTKHGAAKLVSQLEKRGIQAESFHSGRSQAVREQVLQDFKSGKVKYIVATGVVARGIDIDNLNLVINYDLPYPADEYIHRIGRTGRAGNQGQAVSLLSKDDFKNFCAIERKLQQIIERRVEAEFEPKKPLPKSDLNFVPKKKPASKLDDTKPSKPERMSKSHGAKGHSVTQIGKKSKSNKAKRTQLERQRSDKPTKRENTDNGNTKATPNGDGSFNPWLKR